MVCGKELGELYYPTWNIKRIDRQKEMLKFKKKCLIYNHENMDFQKWGWHAGEDEIGKSRYRYDVLILRSFKNMLASWLRNKPEKWDKFEKQIIPLYKLYTDEFLKMTHYLEFQSVTIWFDVWVKSKAYRKKKALVFGRNNKDWTLQYMANFSGRGSHFDDITQYYDRAKEMKINERYKQMKDHPKYIEFMKKYRKLHQVSNRIHKEAHSL